MNGLLYSGIEEDAFDLLSRMLKIDPKERISAH